MASRKDTVFSQSVRRLEDAPDHDVLITLVETVRTNHSAILDKVENVQQGVTDLKEGFNYTLTEHEQRLRVIEKVHDQMDPFETRKMAQESYIFVKNYNDEQSRTSKRQLFWVSLISTAITIIIQIASSVGGWFRPIH